jgi:hemoglobin
MTLSACVVVLSGTLLRVEAQGDSKAADKLIFDTLRDVINKGADLYNGGDWNGCYRLYEGALMTLKPALGHRPALQKAIDDGIARARANAALDRRAFDLRTVIDTIRAETNPNPKPPPMPKTLWERLGGEDGVKKVVDDLVATAATDPKVNFDRNGKVKVDVPKLKKQVVAFFSSATGGPIKYTGKSMKEAHKGMGITEAEFNAFAGHLKAALEKNGVKADDVKTVMTAVGGTKADIVEPKKPPEPPSAKTLWDRLGGEAGVKKVVDDFVGAAAADPKVNFDRNGKVKVDVPKLKKSLVDFFSAATGGPFKYTGKSMKDAHKGMGITEAEFNATAGHLKASLEKNGVKPDDVKAVMDAVGGTKADIVEPKKPEPPKDKPDDKDKTKDKDKPDDKSKDKDKAKDKDKPKL